MSLDTITLPSGLIVPLGCVPPDSFPDGPAVTKFADAFANDMLTLDEIRAELAKKNGKSMYGRRERFAGTKYIRSQRSYGSCNGWSTAAILSRIRELRGEPYVCLSGADAYSQMNGGRDNGSALIDGEKVCANGIATEATVPWDHVYSWQIPAAAKAERARFKGFTTFAVDEEAELATALMLGEMGVIAVHASNAFMAQDGDGVNKAGNGVGNHSVGAQDLKMLPDGTLCFDMPNSWDVTYCDGGYTWLTWNKHLRETVKYHRFWVLCSSTDDSGDDSTPPPVKG